MTERTYAVFRHLAIERAEPPPTPGEIAAIEQDLGAALPRSFLDFLRVANGGYLEYVIDVPTGDGRSEAISFCAIFSTRPGEHSDGTFVGEIAAARDYVRAPRGVLPFARDGGGSMAYLDLSVDGGGRVVAFVEGLPEWAGVRSESAFVRLADSFDDFVSKLRIDRGAVIDQLEHDATALQHVLATEEYLDIGLPDWRRDEELSAAVRAARRRLAG